MNWTELSLKKYNEIKDLYLDENLSDEDRLILQINILFGVDALKLKTSELHKYVNEMKFLATKPPKMKLKKKTRLTLLRQSRGGCLYLDGLVQYRSFLRTLSLLLGKRKLIISLHNYLCLNHLSRNFANQATVQQLHL